MRVKQRYLKKKGGKVKFAILHVSYDDFKQFWNFVYTKRMSFLQSIWEQLSEFWLTLKKKSK